MWRSKNRPPARSDFTDQQTLRGCRTRFGACRSLVFCGIPEACTRWNCMLECDAQYWWTGRVSGLWPVSLDWPARRFGRCWSSYCQLNALVERHLQIGPEKRRCDWFTGVAALLPDSWRRVDLQGRRIRRFAVGYAGFRRQATRRFAEKP